MYKTANILALIIMAAFLITTNVFGTPIPILYGINDDFDRIERYDNGTITILEGSTPDEIESLTWAGGTTYYGMQSTNKHTVVRYTNLILTRPMLVEKK